MYCEIYVQPRDAITYHKKCGTEKFRIRASIVMTNAMVMLLTHVHSFFFSLSVCDATLDLLQLAESSKNWEHSERCQFATEKITYSGKIKALSVCLQLRSCKLKHRIVLIWACITSFVHYNSMSQIQGSLYTMICFLENYWNK